MKKIIVALILAFSTVANAADKLESAYYQVERNVKIVITNQPCTLFDGGNEPLGYAYAINTDTADQVNGCFANRDGIAHIELTGVEKDKDGKESFSHYTYDYDLRKFQPSETM